MNVFTVRLYKLIICVKCPLLEVPREELKLFTGLAECLLKTMSHFHAQVRSVFSMLIFFLRSLNMKKAFISHMDLFHHLCFYATSGGGDSISCSAATGGFAGFRIPQV